MENITLYFKEGASDKVYQATIEPKDGGYVVNFAYGRRGNTLTSGSKNTAPVCYDEAQCIFNKLIAEKQAKGYTPGEDGMPYRQTGRELQSTGIHCQLLNPITEIDAKALIADPAWCLQEKFDGRRLLIRKEGDVVTGINRLGLSVAIPESIAASAEAIPADFIIDGEAVGDCLHVGVKYQTFATWRQKRNRQRRASDAPALSSPSSVPSLPPGVQWLEAVLENPASPATGKTSDRAKADCVLSIALPGGARVEFSDAAQVKLIAELLRALEVKGHAAC